MCTHTHTHTHTHTTSYDVLCVCVCVCVCACVCVCVCLCVCVCVRELSPHLPKTGWRHIHAYSVGTHHARQLNRLNSVLHMYVCTYVRFLLLMHANSIDSIVSLIPGT
jgi:hypothetical protein